MAAIKTLLWKLTVMSLAYYLVTMAIIFISAGTIHYPEGWNYIIAMIFISSIMSIYFLITDPKLIEVRMKQEEDKTQKLIRAVLYPLFAFIYIIAGLDFRFQWSKVPMWIENISMGLLIIGYVITFFVFKENTYTSSNIKVYENQKVITTGVYSKIRHPMYSGAFIIILATSLILGSYWSLIPSAFICILIVYRAVEEEKILARDLKGYKEYMAKVKFRFIPGII